MSRDRLSLAAVFALSVLLPAASGHAGASQLGNPLVVVDSKGAVVGPFLPMGKKENTAGRQINGVFYALGVGPAGFVNNSTFLFYYESSNCSGTPYFPAPKQLVIDATYGAPAGIFANTLYFGKSPAHSLDYQSFAEVSDPTKPVPADDCTTASGSESVESVETFDLTTLNLTPPFKVIQ